ncbi:hypothetical protein LY90DRAFT_427243 [Neocallimastix californiae]|uniref:Splicing factor Cactin n=1 Tax=Neocallimastix californiae TaxID=1754190 RepID=A0A1Y2AV08_9FUNG|nr:hypothetical protein LY90DRAFT_427243 [Neocallimastix californiae]|eukprot:ORY26120.1 hypothetical protein LY90DRAFT_427243 [Neocallimastix californiae]
MAHYSSDSDREGRKSRSRKHNSRSKRHYRSSSSDSESSSRERHSRRRHESKRHRKHSKRHDSEEKERIKEEKRAQQEAQIAAQMTASLGYTNTDNPFGDSNLTQKFVWQKKREQEAKQGITAAERLRMEKERHEETMMEMEKLKRRREERENEMRLREEEQMRLQRDQDRLALGDWEAKEKKFHLEQAKNRAKIRFKEGRIKPIDVLALNINSASDPTIAENFESIDINMELDEPYKLFENLSLRELEELQGDIQYYLELENEEKKISFWKSLLIICDEEISKHKSIGGPTTGISDGIEDEIHHLMENKTYNQLCKLEEQVKQKLSDGGPIDVEYWEVLLKALVVWKAKAKIKEIHTELLAKRIEQLREKQKLEMENNKNDNDNNKSDKENTHEEVYDNEDNSESNIKSKNESIKLPAGEDEEEGDFESLDAIEETQKTYLWQDKYRPRKPRFFNRVHTGYEWNKYNQTHYDVDNPPPKVVQGYKFNIFYPDLIDKTKTPTYRIEKDSGYPDTIIIRFIAGPPYEDIAFRIVNREWEHSHKKGFKCSFDKNVLQLHFHFRRNYYRR